MKIIIVDDDCLVAAALKTILEVNEDVQVAATGVNGKEACQLYEEYQPDVLLMDIRVKALRLGAKGYLLKQDYGSILPAIRAVDSGQTVFGTQITSRLPELLMGKQGFDYGSYDINERELEIIRLIANGCSNKEIAAELFLSEGTVRNYLSSILEKLQLRDRTQVAVFYYQHR